MKIKHLLTFAVVAAVGGTANAQITDGDYFIQNVESGEFLNGANSWGTKASATKHGQKMGVAVSGAGYTIDSRISNGGNKHYVNQGDNLFVDGVAVAHTIKDLGGGVYTVQSPNGDYLVQEGAFVNFKSVEVTDAAKWKFLSMDDMFKTLDEATADNPVDATFFVDDANFSRNNTLFSAWKGGPAKGGENDNMCAEAYNKVFDVYQTVSGVPAGNYKVYCQGFFRYGYPEDAQKNYGSEDMSLFPILYANDSETPLQTVLNEETLKKIQAKGITVGAWSDVKVNGSDYKIPFNMNAASACFSAGLYSTSLDVKVGDTGAIRMGFKKTAANNPEGNWTIFDNFEIYFYGVDVEAAKAAMTALQGKATALYDSPYLSAAAKSALEKAVSESNLSEAPKASEVASKTTALQNAIKDAQADITANHQADILVNPQPGDDLTFVIVNPTIDGQTGWTCEKPNGNGPLLGGTSFEYWCGNVATRSEAQFDYYQIVTGLPNGKYEVSAEMYNSLNGNANDTFAPTCGLYAGENTVAVDVDGTTLAKYSVEAVVTDGTLRIGVKNFETIAAQWFVADNFSLVYKEPLPKVEVELAVSDAKYATFIAPFDAELPTGVKAYTVTGINADNTVVMEEQAAIVANTPVVLFSESEVSEKLEGVSQATEDTYTVGLLTGVFAPVQITEGYVLQNSLEEGVAFYVVEPTFAMTVPANRAYLTVPSTTDAKVISFGDEATAIKVVGTLTSGNAKIYDINGRELKSLQKGVNIVNGVKVLVK